MPRTVVRSSGESFMRWCSMPRGRRARRVVGVRSVPDGVDASMHAVQPAAVQPRGDLASRDTGRKQLRARDDAVLRRGKRRDESIGSVQGAHTVL